MNNYCPNISKEKYSWTWERAKRESHKLVLNLSQRLHLKNSNKHVVQNLSIYYTWKNIKKQYKNNKFKIIALTWNDVFELPDGCCSVSDIHGCI